MKVAIFTSSLQLVLTQVNGVSPVKQMRFGDLVLGSTVFLLFDSSFAALVSCSDDHCNVDIQSK